ncbi:DUF4232 domain-containing protein [Nocardia stercoris]|uniref:DUF4232 domain-containing protein n=1 Tax=Nocardia stercoris TaxID=2483361 RepID=A0A3M2KXV1_9NOCA|nr:DUF4232 domain-containing protein [Nocardia stercoris]RMI30347.1 DUF4232 domain-containing protein [Nocardia stercoris]
MRLRDAAAWLLIPAAIAVAACAGPAAKSAAPITGRPTPDSTLPAGSNILSSAAVAPECTTSDLSATLGRADTDGDTTTLQLVFTDSGSRTCTMQGFPGVSYADGPDGDPVGPPADRDGATAPQVTLTPGGFAQSRLRVVDYSSVPADECDPVDVTGLRIYPPDDARTMFVTLRNQQTCSGKVILLGIGSIQPRG